MSRLGDFLEALYGPRERFTTVRATLRYWQDRLFADVAADERGVRTAELRGGEAPPAREGWTPGDGPRVCEAEIKVWLAGCDRGREEVRHITGERWFPPLLIVNGVRTSSAERNLFRRSAHRRSGCLSHAERHFGRHHLRQVFAWLDLDEVGSVQVLGRDCVRVRAVPIPDDHIWPHWFPHGAQEYELHVDPERGAVLAIIARVNEAVFETNEVVAVAYDEPLDEGLFTIPTLPPPRVIRRRRKGAG